MTEHTAVRILGLDHVVLRCVNLQATLTFYREVLGCSLERSLEDIGLYQLRAGAALIDLVPIGSTLGGATPPEPDAFNLAHYCLRIDTCDWDAVRTQLEANGIEWVQPARRYGADGFGQSVYITDPEGNVVELKGPPEQESESTG